MDHNLAIELVQLADPHEEQDSSQNFYLFYNVNITTECNSVVIYIQDRMLAQLNKEYLFPSCGIYEE